MTPPNPPDVGGLTWGPATRDDAERLLLCLRAAEEADGVHMVSTLDEVERDLDDIGDDLPTDSLVARTTAGGLAAFATVYVRPGTTRDRRATLWGEVHPEHREGGIEEFVLDWMIARGRHRLGGLPNDLPRFLEVSAHDYLRDFRRRLEDRGFVAARYWSEMGRGLVAPLPDVAAPAGVVLAPWDPGRSEEVRLVHNDAFADHFGTNPLSVEEWDKWFIGGAKFRPDLSFLALAEDIVVGYATSYVYPEDFAVKGRSEAWVGQLGVLAGWRRGGIASALIAACLPAYAADGLDYGALLVDSENPTGAVGLYGRLGFVLERQWVTYRQDY